MNNIAKVKLLCSFLNTSSNTSHALRCIQSETHGQTEVQDWLRVNGYLEVILELSRSSNIITRRWATYCLASCAYHNYDSQAHLSTLSLYTHIYTILDHRLSTTADQYVSLLLIDAICSGNPCSQELVCTSGCLHLLMDKLGELLHRDRSQCTGETQQLRQLVVQCLKSSVSRPAHEGNQLAVTAHPVFSEQVLPAIQGGTKLASDTLDCVCEVISAVYQQGEEGAAATALHRDAVTCALCSHLQSISRRNSLTKYHRAIYSLVKSLISIGQSQVELHPTAAAAVSALLSRILTICNHSNSTELQQTLMFLLLCLLNRADSSDECLLKEGGVRRLYAMTKLTDDPTVHCAVSYVLLGLSHLTREELTLVRQITPGALVRMGMAVNKASQLANKHERVVTTTRKQLFESDEIMELMSSDDELEQVPEDMEDGKSQQATSQKWLQLTPPSKSRRNALSSSPGWTVRVKRLKSVLKQRHKRKKMGQKSTEKFCSTKLELANREPLKVINV